MQYHQTFTVQLNILFTEGGVIYAALRTTAQFEVTIILFYWGKTFMVQKAYTVIIQYEKAYYLNDYSLLQHSVTNRISIQVQLL